MSFKILGRQSSDKKVVYLGNKTFKSAGRI